MPRNGLTFHARFYIKTYTRTIALAIPTVQLEPSRSNFSRMRFTRFLVFCVLVLYLHEGTGLKCRSGDRRTNDQFQKIMHRCRDRILQGNRKVGDGMSSSDDDSDSDDDSYDDDDSTESDEKEFDRKIVNGRTGTTDMSLMKNSGPNNNGDRKNNSRKYEQNSSPRPYPYDRIMNNTYSSSKAAGVANDRFSRNNTNLRNGGYNNMANSGHNNNNNNNMQTNQHDQACVIQCFFDELNLIDRNGFPEKSAVTKIMMQNIRDPELQEFVEEAVMDCFYMIDVDKNKEQCRFSQNLLNCLAGKGRDRCEDWDQ